LSTRVLVLEQLEGALWQGTLHLSTAYGAFKMCTIAFSAVICLLR
jgi:hypothetical protein